MPDVITVTPKLREHWDNHDLHIEPLKWNFENPIYVEFKSAQEMRSHPERLERQLDQYEGIPLYLWVEAKFYEVKDMLKEHDRHQVPLSTLFREPEGGMVFLRGTSDYSQIMRAFERVIKKVKEAFDETYDYKARLKKTGLDPRGRERYDLVLYDSADTSKDIGQVIPKYASDIPVFSSIYFHKKLLGRIITADYIYTPERKPTDENKTWKWKKEKTKGAKFRSFRA